MKITHLGSATELIETNGIKILTDPWLVDGAYYGSWCHYPPIELDKIDLSDVDFVYVSHVHPDHFDPRTLQRVPRQTPILIHRFQMPFLKANIEKLGFPVVEIPHDEPFSLGKNVTIRILGADNCDPQICGRMFGCVPSASLRGSMQLDSLCVINDGQFTLVNTNDCPYEIAATALQKVKADYGVIDFALTGYSSASLFPHCMADYDKEMRERGKQVAMKRGLTSGLKTLRVLKPKHYMPFAGTYVLGGTVAWKTSDMPIVELQDAVAHFDSDSQIRDSGARPVLLNSGQHFDLATGTQSSPYEAVDPTERSKYVSSVLAKKPLAYEDDPLPSLLAIEELLPACFRRFDLKRREIGVSEDHVVYVKVPDEHLVRLPLNGDSYTIETELRKEDHAYSIFDMDERLLFRILRGPAHANWNNIEIGAHMMFRRKPDIYNLQTHILMNFFHV